ncbi:MAG: hypothetical protein H7Y20_09310 [Bryobacteraceae bacterium]|nr:hypothetical protein [Bryobacteraceae bacterium]
MAELHKKFGQEIKLPQMFVDPTPAAMARLLEPDRVSVIGEQFVHVQPDGSRSPFFMIAGDHWFRPLATHVGLDQPFLGVPLLSFGDISVESRRQAAADKIAQDLLKTFPGERFMLGGWCDAGVTAYEVARAIHQRGGIVGLVVLFDAMNPDYHKSLQSVVAAGSRVLHVVRDAAKRNRDQGVLASVSSVAREMQNKFVRGVQRLPALFENSEAPQHVTFPITLLRPAIIGSGDPELGWRRVCPHLLTVEEVPGDHTTIFQMPTVVAVARRLREHLDRALERQAPAIHQRASA